MASLFGSGDKPKPFVPKGFSSGGLNVTMNNGSANVQRTQQLTDLLGSLKSASDLNVSELGSIRGQLKPGFGRLTETGVQSIRNRRRQAIGNIRENLSRRRVLGSSFAQDALSRGEAEFSQQEADFRAKTTLQELNIELALIDAQHKTRQSYYNTMLAQSNFESNIGANVQAGLNNALEAAQRFEAQLAAEEAKGKGQAVGMVVGTIIGAYFGGKEGAQLGALAGAKAGGEL
ncbi:MAG: hypothetical protein OEZ68_02385 [Gammaproteobacteria bacterium]|nr:hypothetical protein [Gammaproteobacteria bacterium]MDH5799630.1 hypothetical protein [Gammaproteobacteria bacterium]